MDRRVVILIIIFVAAIIISALSATVLFSRLPKHDGRRIIGVDGQIHAVLTWVDSSDPEWKKKKSLFDGSDRSKLFDDRRYGDGSVTNIEIETATLSILRCATWIDKIWIATDDQIPSFISRLTPAHRRKVGVVFHKNFFINKSILPTFNSHTIEANLHNIPGLADRFIYMNDDMMFTSLVKKSHFFQNGIPCYRPINIVNIKQSRYMKPFINIFAPSSIMYLDCTSNLYKYGNPMFIWRYSHHCVPLLRSYFNSSTQYKNLDRLSRFCTSKFRCANDIPPIHAAVLQAYQDKRCYIYKGEKYITTYMEGYEDCELDCYHEICVNNITNKHEAMKMRSRVLGFC